MRARRRDAAARCIRRTKYVQIAAPAHGRHRGRLAAGIRDTCPDGQPARSDGPQVTFASESFIDELPTPQTALTRSHSDPRCSRAWHWRRCGLLQSGRDRSPAEGGSGEVRVAGPCRRRRCILLGDVVIGRGVAYVFCSEMVRSRDGRVEVNRRTGWGVGEAHRCVCTIAAW